MTTNVAATLDRITDLFEKWAAEEDEHRRAGEYGIAEGLSVAIEELREAVHGAVREESEPEPVTGGSCPSCDGYEAALAEVESRLQTTTQAYAVTAERLGNARKAIKRHKEQRDDARVRVQLLVNGAVARQRREGAVVSERLHVNINSVTADRLRYIAGREGIDYTEAVARCVESLAFLYEQEDAGLRVFVGTVRWPGQSEVGLRP